MRTNSWPPCFALVPVVSGRVEHKCVLVYDVPSLYQTTLTSETVKSSVKCVVRTHLTEDVKSRQTLKSSALFTVFISLIRMRSKRDIKMGRLCTPGGAVLGIVGGGVTFRFLNGEAILEENMLFWVRLYALVVVLKILLDFRL